MRPFSEEVNALDYAHLKQLLEDAVNLAPEEDRVFVRELARLLEKDSLEKLQKILNDTEKKRTSGAEEPSAFRSFLKKINAFQGELNQFAQQINTRINQSPKKLNPQSVESLNRYLIAVQKKMVMGSLLHFEGLFADVIARQRAYGTDSLESGFEQIDALTWEYFNGDLHGDPKEYLRRCEQVLYNEIGPAVQGYNNYWNTLGGLFRGFLPHVKGFFGVLAALMVIPALAVEFGTKKGYSETFFEAIPEEKVKRVKKGLKKIVELEKIKIKNNGQ